MAEHKTVAYFDNSKGTVEVWTGEGKIIHRGRLGRRATLSTVRRHLAQHGYGTHAEQDHNPYGYGLTVKS